MSEAPTARWHVVPDLDLLQSEVPAERRRAVESLGRVGDAQAVELLSVCLSDPDVDVTYDAAQALADVGSDVAVAGLLRVVADETSPIVRRVVAAYALGDVQGLPEHAVRALRQLLVPGADCWLQAAARNALGRLTHY